MGKSPRPQHPKPKNAYDSDSYEISSDEEPKTVLQNLKQSLKGKLSPSERARIAAEKKEERRGMIEFGMENLVDGYPKSLTEEEWELVERIRRHPKERRRFEPVGRARNEGGRREEFRPEFGKTVKKSVVGEEGGGGEFSGPGVGTSGQASAGSLKNSRVPPASQRTPSLTSSQRAIPSYHSSAPPPYIPTIQSNNSIPKPRRNQHHSAPQLSNNIPNSPISNPRHFAATQPNITIAHPTTPSGTKIHQHTTLADLGNMNRTFVEGFDAPPGSKMTSGKATQMKRGLGNMQRTYLQGLVEENGSEDEKKVRRGKGKGR